MKIQTMSIVIGGNKCNAHCPFCVAKMTQEMKYNSKNKFKNFDNALRLAEIGGVTTVLLTGKGEPTLYPDLITEYLEVMFDDYKNYSMFPFVELQTNGIELFKLEEELKLWRGLGLTTICLSNMGYDHGYNEKIFSKNYNHIGEMVPWLDDLGFTVRLTTMLSFRGIYQIPEVERMIEYARTIGAKQLTMRDLKFPKNYRNSAPYEYVMNNRLGGTRINCIRAWLDHKGTKVMKLAHGAYVYDVNGQNVCLADCLTTDQNSWENIRQIIYWPDGTIGYDWSYKGANLL